MPRTIAVDILRPHLTVRKTYLPRFIACWESIRQPRYPTTTAGRDTCSMTVAQFKNLSEVNRATCAIGLNDYLKSFALLATLEAAGFFIADDLFRLGIPLDRPFKTDADVCQVACGDRAVM